MFFFKSKNIKNLSDPDLIAHYRNTGENRYLENLLDRYYHLVFGVCLKYLKDETKSEETCALVFEKLSKEIHKNEIQNLSSWLVTVTKNSCLTFLRNETRKNNFTTIVDFSTIPEEEDIFTDEPEDKESMFRNLEKALAVLKPVQKTCIELFYLQDKCYKEICDTTGLELKEVKSHLQNGRRSLKILVSNQNEKIRQKIS